MNQIQTEKMQEQASDTILYQIGLYEPLGGCPIEDIYKHLNVTSNHGTDQKYNNVAHAINDLRDSGRIYVKSGKYRLTHQASGGFSQSEAIYSTLLLAISNVNSGKVPMSEAAPAVQTSALSSIAATLIDIKRIMEGNQNEY